MTTSTTRNLEQHAPAPHTAESTPNPADTAQRTSFSDFEDRTSSDLEWIAAKLATLPNDCAWAGPNKKGIFVWIAEDDHMAASKTIPIRKGYHVLIQSLAIVGPDDMVLAWKRGGRPVLRRITDSGSGWMLVTESGEIPPEPFNEEADEIIGAVCTAMWPPKIPRRKNTERGA